MGGVPWGGGGWGGSDAAPYMYICIYVCLYLYFYEFLVACLFKIIAIY